LRPGPRSPLADPLLGTLKCRDVSLHASSSSTDLIEAKKKPIDDEVVMSEESVKLFISYSHLDEEMKNQLNKHLTSMRNEGVIEAWHDRQIEAGTDWANSIDAYLNN
jgi:hypothetical protein